MQNLGSRKSTFVEGSTLKRACQFSQWIRFQRHYSIYRRLLQISSHHARRTSPSQIGGGLTPHHSDSKFVRLLSSCLKRWLLPFDTGPWSAVVAPSPTGVGSKAEPGPADSPNQQSPPHRGQPLADTRRRVQYCCHFCMELSIGVAVSLLLSSVSLVGFQFPSFSSAGMVSMENAAAKCPFARREKAACIGRQLTVLVDCALSGASNTYRGLTRESEGLTFHLGSGFPLGDCGCAP